MVWSFFKSRSDVQMLLRQQTIPRAQLLKSNKCNSLMKDIGQTYDMDDRYNSKPFLIIQEASGARNDNR